VPQQASWDEWGRGYHGGPRGAKCHDRRRGDARRGGRSLAQDRQPGRVADRAATRVRRIRRGGAPGGRNSPEASRAIGGEKSRGLGDAAAQDPSHFKRFLDIYRDFKRTAHPQGWDPAHEVAVNPTVGAQTGCAEITDVRSRHWASLFNLRYRMLLAYRGRPRSTVPAGS